MQIRRATAGDLEKYRDQARMFHSMSPIGKSISFDESGYSTFYLNALKNPSIGMWLAEINGEIVGIAGALLYHIYFSPSTLVAQELWWWLDPISRGTGAGPAMFTYIEKWAVENNAKAIFMIALENDRVDAMVKAYKRSGYSPMERTFMKEV